jgi:hypothetical protein
MAAFDRKRVRAALAIASSISVAILASCNGILGVDSFHEGPALVDGGEGGVVDGFASDTGFIDGSNVTDAALEAETGTVTLPPGSQPATWVAWKMPDRVTGCPNPPSYGITTEDAGTDGGDGGYAVVPVVVDNVTKLVWMQGATVLQPGSDDFAGAKAACDNATPKGTWRLPTRIELISILDHIDDAGAPKSPTIDGVTFPLTPAYPFWTASPVLQPLANPPQFWLVDFKTGTLTSALNGPYVRCVKGAK